MEIHAWHPAVPRRLGLPFHEYLPFFYTLSQHLQETIGEADDEDEDSDDSEEDDEAIKDEFKFHMKVEEGGGSGLLMGGPNSGAPVTLSVVEGTNEITGKPTRVEFDPSQPLTTEIMGGKRRPFVFFCV